MVSEEGITAYKAFDDDMTCREFKYEVGATYEHKGKIEMCRSGFHACRLPFDCFAYYPNATKLARVTLWGVSDKGTGDSKVVGAKIRIDKMLDMRAWTQAQVGALLDSHSATSGNDSHSATSGNYSHSATSGENSIAAALGRGSTAQSTNGNWIVLAAYDDKGNVVIVKTFQVGVDGVKPNTPYRLNSKGDLVEARQ